MKLDSIHKSIVSRIPSLQDIISAIATFQIGKASKIFPEDNGEVALKPIRGRRPRVDAKQYEELVKAAIEANNLDIIIDGLRNMGIEMTYSDTASFRPPAVSGKEVGGVGGTSRGEGGKRATELKRVGTRDHVELEVPYGPEDVRKPEEGLEDTDETFVYHTHPKMADNNYFPGRSQPR